VRLLLHSNGPNTPTGYGVQTALLASRLRDAGHEVAISVYYGHQTGLGSWDGIPLLPCSGEAYGNDVLHDHAIRWFNGDPLGGWIIPIMDVFGLSSPALREFNVAAWTPVDHEPAPVAVTEFFARTDAVPVAMSRFGEHLLRQKGLDPKYVPLAVDTTLFAPVDDAKRIAGFVDDQFVVMINGMNKGAYPSRKGFPEAFIAFGQFAKRHPDAVLLVHSEQWGPYANGINLIELAMASGIAEHQLKFCDQYAYRCGFISPEQLATAYSAADVLLAPSRGEGFCVPLIEAQACGTPVIVSRFSAQPELVGAGWTVSGERDWDPALQAWYMKADVRHIIDALEQAYEERGSEINRDTAIGKAREYDADLVFDRYWKPLLAEMAGEPVELDRPKIPSRDGVAVIVPVLSRPQNVQPLVDSFRSASGRGVANLYFVCDADDPVEIAAVKDAGADVIVYTADKAGTYAQKVNWAFGQTSEPWIFVAGDDVRFHKGWIDAARGLSDEFDVIGTNDSLTGQGNPKVANGSHADHFFVRRSYVDEHGGSLQGGVFHEGYGHFYSDVELVELAKARRVFTPCLASMVEHLHPDMGLAEPDDVYRKGWSQRSADEAEWLRRRPFVAMQVQGLGRVREA